MDSFTIVCGNVTLFLRERTHIMGILNVTPDSFSDGGKYFSIETAISHGLTLVKEGADILDIGGESTRPGALPVDETTEISRVLPVIEKLAATIKIPISIDTTKASVAEAALIAGASIINDVSGARFDPKIVSVAAKYNAPLVLMHMRGNPRTMQQNIHYTDVIQEIRDFLKERIQAVSAQGVSQIILDPGIGFGKRIEDNLKIVARLHDFSELNHPVLIGVSRKSFLGALTDTPDVLDRVYGTCAANAVSILEGASILRVHDVRPARQVARLIDAIKNERGKP